MTTMFTSEKNDYVSHLQITDNASDVQKVADWLQVELQRLNVSSELTFKFDLCANEIISNIISYAFSQQTTLTCY